MGWEVLGSVWPWKKENEEEIEVDDVDPPRPPMTEIQRDRFMKRFKTFQQENKRNISYVDHKKVEEDLNEHPFIDRKENPTAEELEENKKFWEKIEDNKLVKFLAISEKIAEMELKEALEENKLPYWEEDEKLWKALPPVPGPFNGPPMPRKAIFTDKEAKNKVWDFMKEYLFGLWAYKGRPYPPGRPIDVTQALGTEFLEGRYYDFAMKYGSWYYKDRLGRTRGPMEIINLKTAMASGIVDKHTFVWGDDMDEWAPIGMIYGLEAAVNTPDVKLAAAGTALVHKLARGLPPWIPVKGRENKTYKQLQKEGIESKEWEKAVMRQHGGVSPGQMIPSHTLFLWASGTELTPLIEADTLPNKFISYNLRKDMAKLIPGLRPWQVLKLEQIMEIVSYNPTWFRNPLGKGTTRPPYALTKDNARRKRHKKLFLRARCFEDEENPIEFIHRVNFVLRDAAERVHRKIPREIKIRMLDKIKAMEEEERRKEELLRKMRGDDDD